MYLEIVTPDKTIYTGEVKAVQLPGSNGSFEVLKNHAPIVSTLESGMVKVIDLHEQETLIQVISGVVEVVDNNVVVLAEKI